MGQAAGATSMSFLAVLHVGIKKNLKLLLISGYFLDNTKYILTS